MSGLLIAHKAGQFDKVMKKISGISCLYLNFALGSYRTESDEVLDPWKAFILGSWVLAAKLHFSNLGDSLRYLQLGCRNSDLLSSREQKEEKNIWKGPSKIRPTA